MNRSNREQPERSITRGSDFLQLDPSEAPPRGLSDWLAGRLRDAIADGRLPVGSRLPATRVLAAELRVSRGVVTEAYQRLADEGHLAGRGRAGTVVVAAPLTPAPRPGRPDRLGLRGPAHCLARAAARRALPRRTGRGRLRRPARPARPHRPDTRPARPGRVPARRVAARRTHRPARPARRRPRLRRPARRPRAAHRHRRLARPHPRDPRRP
ncbi:GntR family transcriptional regulator [Actinomadura madurae]|uniref:GntR family transcriptional regulator n=1 Tax=Actinomadura madurae TaxID=1993 RepID=UPI0020D25788|nr:winged helix-turn-helix domain-containing protein [Actinomadura madurae]MCQ0011532.1 winged helix-turn-helix domain-containing protein [Actinomadura madurae]